MKRIVSLLMAVLLVLGCSTGIAEYDKENVHFGGKYPIVDDPSAVKPLRVVAMKRPTAVGDFNESAQVKWQYEQTGVPIEWVLIDQANYSEQVGLMLATNDLPDIFYHNIGSGKITQYMDYDMYVKLDEYLEYAPNITAAFERRPEYKALATAADGHMYGFPYVEELDGLVRSGGAVMINKNWLDKLGLEMPTTTDALYDVLVAFASADDLNGNGLDDEIAIAANFAKYGGRATACPFFILNGAFGTPMTAGNSFPFLSASKDGTITFGAASEAFKTNLNYFADLYKAGVISDNSFSDYNYENDLKGDAAIYGVVAAWTWAESRVPNREVRDQYVVMSPVYGPDGDIWNNVCNTSEFGSASYGVITTACDQVELAVAWLDFLSTPEASLTTNWGAEGYAYTRDDNGYLAMALDEKGNRVTCEFDSAATLRWSTSPLTQGPYMVLSDYFGVYGDMDTEAMPALENQIINGKRLMEEVVNSIPPAIPFTVEDQEIYAQVSTAVSNIVQSYIVSSILNDDVDDTWENYCKSLEDAGLTDYITTTQNAYNRYLNNMM